LKRVGRPERKVSRQEGEAEEKGTSLGQKKGQWKDLFHKRRKKPAEAEHVEKKNRRKTKKKPTHKKERI